MVRPGQSVSREAIAQVVRAHGDEQGQPYAIRWEVAKRGEPRQVGRAVPFRAPLLAGGEVEVRAPPGRPVVVVFWASWCKPCLEEAPHLERLFREHAGRVDFVAVSIDEAAQLAELRRVVGALQVTYPIALDPGGASVMAKFAGATSIPLTFVIAADGTIRYTQRNYQAGDDRALARAIATVAPE